MNKRLLPVAWAAAMLSLGGLSGCASMPEGYDSPISQRDLVTEMRDAWSATPAVTHVPSRAGQVVRKHGELPAALAAERVSLRVAHEVSLTDVLYALDAQGYHVLSRLSDTHNGKIFPGEYEGSLGRLLERLSFTMDVGYEYRNGLIFVTDANRYSVSLPQHKALLDEVVSALTDMGAENVRADLPAGLINYRAKPSVAEHIESYIEAVARNSAMVTLQVAVLTVNLNRDRALGFDWGSLTSQFGTKDFKPGVASGVSEALKHGAMSTLTGDGLAYRFVSTSFSLTAALRALSTYGDARTDQNVLLGTMSGVPVSISSGNEIPYVENIGDRVDANGNVTGGTTSTSTVSSGLKLTVTPYFDANDMSVVTGVDVDMSSLVGFRELSAGSALGSLSRPELQKLTFENLSRLQAGETIIIGGITYDQLSNNHTSFPGMERAPVGSVSSKTNRHAIFIVVRPSVVIFGEAPKPAQAPEARGAASSVSQPPAAAPVAVAPPADTPTMPEVVPDAREAVEAAAEVEEVSHTPPPGAVVYSRAMPREVTLPAQDGAAVLPEASDPDEALWSLVRGEVR